VKLDPDTLYECGAQGGGVAGHAVYDRAHGVVTWINPGGRQRSYDVDVVVEDSDTVFAFTDHLGRKFALTPLTPEGYNDRVRRPGQPRYPTQAALEHAYWLSLGWPKPPP
jgi:hypothetical protein